MSLIKAIEKIALIKSSKKQYNLITKIEKYFELKLAKLTDPIARQNCVIPYNSKDGLYSGLVAYWLYSKRIGKDNNFEREFNYVLNWDSNQFANSTDMEDPHLERFINDIMLLHFDSTLRLGLKQENMHKSMAFLLTDDSIQVKSDDFNSTFVFNFSTLTSFLNTFIHEEKMVRISNGSHAIGLIVQHGRYFVYNPVGEPVEFSSSEEAALAVFSLLVKPSDSSNHVALNFNIFDLEDAEPTKYHNLLEYYTKLTQEQEYFNIAINHPNLFHLAARHGDYKTMDFLFSIGYSYKPWQGTELNPITEAIRTNQPEILNYLLKKGLSANQLNRNRSSPLWHATNINSLELTAELLAAGADPNSSLEYAIEQQSAGIIALLLGCGAQLDKKTKKQLSKVFPKQQVALIYDNAAAVTAEILQLDPKATLKSCHDGQLIAYLQKTQVQQLNPIEIIKLLNKIHTYITSKPYDLHSMKELRELHTTLDTLDGLIKPYNCWELRSAMIINSAKNTKNKLQKYLDNNHAQSLPIVPKVGLYFATQNERIEPLAYGKRLEEIITSRFNRL